MLLERVLLRARLSQVIGAYLLSLPLQDSTVVGSLLLQALTVR